MEEPEQKRSQAYVEIIGDTVVGKDLIMTISISVVLSFLGFFAGRELIFPRIAPEEMILSYSLLSHRRQCNRLACQHVFI